MTSLRSSSVAARLRPTSRWRATALSWRRATRWGGAVVTVQRPVLAPLHTRAETTSETQTRAHAGWQGGAGPVVAAACLASCLLDLPPHKHTQHPLLKTTTPQVGKEELIQFLRRTSRGSGPQGGNGTSSAYRGVSKHVKGRWEARIGLAPVDGKRRYRWVGGGHACPFPACLLSTLCFLVSRI